jgi:hypothetical protein
MAAFVFIMWFLIGYLYWRAVYYGTIKYWYKEYHEDYSESIISKSWETISPVIMCGGMLNLIFLPFFKYTRRMVFKYGITFYYKVPEGVTKSRF